MDLNETTGTNNHPWKHGWLQKIWLPTEKSIGDRMIQKNEFSSDRQAVQLQKMISRTYTIAVHLLWAYNRGLYGSPF